MDELHLLRATRNTTGTVPPKTLAAGREKLMQRAAAEETVDEEPAADVLRPRRPWRRVILASAAAAAIVAGLVVADVAGSGERPGATAEAIQVLSDAAAATITTSDPVLAPGQYLLVDTEAVYAVFSSTETGQQHVWLESQNGQMYVPADRSGEWIWNREAGEAVQFFDEESRAEARLQAAQSDYQGEYLRAPAGQFYGSGQSILGAIPLEEAIAGAPRDPKELLELIYDNTRGSGPTPDEEAFITIVDTLNTGVIPADLRAALYQAAALIPGLTVVESEATLDGRTGVSLGMATSRYEA